MDIYGFLYDMPRNVGYILSGIFSFLQVGNLLLWLGSFVFGGIGLYAICKRRCIPNAWLAWIPVVRMWTLGSISDQYRYVTKGQVKSKRKVLLILEIITLLLSAATTALVVRTLINFTQASYYGTEAEIVASVMGGLVGLVVLSLLTMTVGIIRKVFRCMVAYDLYQSADPSYSVLFLVAVIFLGFLEPYFIFFLRKKDAGMPPRYDVPVQPIDACAEPWDA